MSVIGIQGGDESAQALRLESDAASYPSQQGYRHLVEFHDQRIALPGDPAGADDEFSCASRDAAAAALDPPDSISREAAKETTV